jgi:hypothetical protein
MSESSSLGKSSGLLPQPSQQPKTTLNNFCWGGIIIGKKKTTPPPWCHYNISDFKTT